MNILRLKEVLKEKGMSGKELSGRVGVTPASISNIVQGNSFPKPDLLLKIAEVLDVDIRDLFTSTKEVNRETVYIKRGGRFISIGELKI